MIKIGIDVQSSQGQTTGLGVYTSSLVQSLSSESRNGTQICLLAGERKGDLNTLGRLRWENVELPRKVKEGKIRLLHVPAFSPPMIKSCRVIVTVHDLIGMLFPNQKGWPSRFYWGKWLPARIKQADFLIAVSEHTKKDVIRYLGVSEKKIKVIHSSGHEGFSAVRDSACLQETRGRFGIREKYFLSVGTLEPRKNLQRVIQAFARFRREIPSGNEWQLVVAGSKDFARGKFFREMTDGKDLSMEDIIFTGYVKREDLNTLYSGAAAFLFPSLYEGFGFPVLEAMASGTPVLTSDRTSLPEIAGEAALAVNPEDVNAISEGMKLFAADEKARVEFIQKGFERIKHFSWSQTAKETLAVYESLC